MIEAAEQHAKENGFAKVYIPSDIKGLYEKYGFKGIDELKNYKGHFDTAFMKIL